MILQLLTLAAAADASSAAHSASNAIKRNRTNGAGSVLIPINELDYNVVSTGFFSSRYDKVCRKYLLPSSKISLVTEITESALDYGHSEYMSRVKSGAKYDQLLVRIDTYDGQLFIVDGSLEDFQNYLISLVQKPKKRSKRKK